MRRSLVPASIIAFLVVLFCCHAYGADAKPETMDGDVINPGNGYAAARDFDCGAMPYYRSVSESFDFAKSWELSLTFVTPRFRPGWQVVAFWGDDRPGLDAVYLRLEGPNLEAQVGDCHQQLSQSLFAKLDGRAAGKPVAVRLRYWADISSLELVVNGRVVQRAASQFTPSVDQRMPFILGGVNATSQRFLGVVDVVQFGNLLDSGKAESSAATDLS